MFRFGSRVSVLPKSRSDVRYQCTVRLLDDTEIQCDIQKDAKGQFLIDHVCSNLNLLEKDYFGLRFVDAEKQRHWLDPIKNVCKQMKSNPPFLLCFRVKFYPPEPYRLHEELTRYELFLQLKRDLLHGRLLCSTEDAAHLGAYIIQAELGDYDQDDHPQGYVSEFKLLAKQSAKLEQKVAELHRDHTRGQAPAEAELNFLRKVKELETYGLDPHPVKDVLGSQIYLGFTHQGVVIFQGNKKTHFFKWKDVQKFTYDSKSFHIYIVANEKKQIYDFRCTTPAAVKHLWKCAVENQAFFSFEKSSDVTLQRSGLARLGFLRGSRFRFSGRTEKEVSAESGKISRQEPQVVRSPTKPELVGKKKKAGEEEEEGEASESSPLNETFHDALKELQPIGTSTPIKSLQLNANSLTTTNNDLSPSPAAYSPCVSEPTTPEETSDSQNLLAKESLPNGHHNSNCGGKVTGVVGMGSPSRATEATECEVSSMSQGPEDLQPACALRPSAAAAVWKAVLSAVVFFTLLLAALLLLVLEAPFHHAAISQIRSTPEFHQFDAEYYQPFKDWFGSVFYL
ncbi:FERM domain-containing protein 5-like isoform X1 [Branchiostoma lanceolatum]|uniref:FERM domain-containing protein 5-like isoform X1 n=1 Tax=Branchiostoma lanceolatum TaxID=7740 RepID=UPI003454F166